MTKKKFFWDTKTKILSYYALLISSLFLLAIPISFQLVLARVEQRVRDDLDEDIEFFQDYFSQKNTLNSFNSNIDKEQLAKILENSLKIRVPEDDNYFIAFLDSQFLVSSPKGRPETLAINSKLMNYWSRLNIKEQKTIEVSDPLVSTVIYQSIPIIIQGELKAVFIIAHTTAGEIREAKESISIVIKIILIMLFLSLLLGWLSSGKILKPLHDFTLTARAINSKNLTQRIPVEGRGEIADLAINFNEMIDRLQMALNNQKNFINDAGHELRTPITIIRGHLELMGDDPQEQKETLDLVMDELDRMNRLVNDLLLLSKSEISDFLHLETLDLPSFIEEIYQKILPLADRHWQLNNQAEKIFQSEPQLQKISCDRQRISQAIINLVQNAVQHTQKGDTITIGLNINKQEVCLSVQDTGEGISLEDQMRIFERFARAKNSRRLSEGSGLGLSIVKAIAHAHQGRVELNSKVGSGSTFTLVLPRLDVNFQER